MTISSIFKKSLSILLFSTISFSAKSFEIKDQLQQKVFLENNGQYDKQDGLVNSDIKFVIDNNAKLFFTPKGLTYKFAIIESKLKEGEEDEKKEKEGKYNIEYQYAHMEWLGANPNVQIIASEKAEGYYTYGNELENKTIKAFAYNKITYKNLYPNIDVEYVFHPVEGIKYNIILHPGANPSVIQMKYTGNKNIFLDNVGNIHIGVKKQADIIDHAPVTYFQSNTYEKIKSSFNLERNIVSFNLGSYDNTQTLVIDPWTTNPAFVNVNKAYNIHKDAANNLYVTGGSNPFYLKKFSPAGVFQWSFTCPNGSNYNVDHVVDPAGNAYINYGAWLGNRTTKVSTAGAQIYNNTAAHGSTPWNNGEAYELTYNCKTSRLYSSGFFYFGNFQVAANNVNVWEQNQNTGAQFSHVNSNTALAIEVRSLESDDNGDVYALSVPVGVNQLGNRLIKLNQNLGLLWNVNSGYNLNESSASFYPSSFNMINGIAIGCFVYTCDGLTLKKWDKTTGAQIGGAVNIPGGQSYMTSGLIVDPCGDVYVGSTTGVHKYNQNLGFISSAATPGTVYDICLGNIPGEVIAVGFGYMNSINMNVCSTISITSTFTPPTCGNCDAIASATSNACGVTYSWSSGPTTPTIGGLCPGTYTCFLVSGCNATTIFTTVVIPNAGNGFTVNATTSTISCLNPNGTVTINSIIGSSGSFTLAEGSNTISTNMVPVFNITNVTAGTHTYVITNAAGCNVIYTITVPTNTTPPHVAIAPPANLSCSLTTVNVVGSSTTANVSYSWTAGPTTSTFNVTNANTYTLTVTDPLNGCKSSSTTVVNFINTLTLTANGSNVLCNGGNSGSATVTATGGSGNYSYTWTPTAQNTSVAINLTAQIYTVTVQDISNSCSSSATVQLTQPNALTLTAAASSPTACANTPISLSALAAGGNGVYTYTWLPNTVAANVNVTEPNGGNYTYTVNAADGNNCLISTAITVTFIANPNLNTVGATICPGATATISATGASNYLWNPGAMAGSNVTVSPLVSTTYTVLGSNGLCTGTAIANVVVNALPTPTALSNSPVCEGTLLQLNGLGGASYSWTGPFGFNANTQNAAISTVAMNNAGQYTLSVVDAFGCSNSTVITVVVNPTPSFTIIPLTATVCAGSSIQLTANGTATSYTWSPAGSLSASIGNAVMSTPAATTNYTVIGELNTCTVAVIRQVQVIDLPTLQATVDKPVICSGQIANINANGASVYNWNPSIGLSSSTSNFVTANPPFTTNYVLTGNNGVCTASIIVPIVVLPNPVLNLSTNNNKICQGSSTSIFAFGAQNYSWSPTDNGNFTNPSIAVVSPSTSTNYTIIGYNTSGTISCYMTQELTIIVVPQATASVSGSVAICAGESVRLSSSGANTYHWYPEKGLDNPHISNPYASPLETTTYSVNVSYEGFCGTTSTVLVKVNPLPIVEAGADYTSNLDEPMFLSATGTGTLTWIFGEEILCKSCPNSQIMPKKSGCYKVEAVSQAGCKAIDEMCVEITTNYNIYIPNSFTPNEDGVNDVFMVYGTGISNIELTIFDRWGEKLFKSTEQTKGWNGFYKNQLSKEDVYVYVVDFQAIDGKKHSKTGHVTLLK